MSTDPFLQLTRELTGPVLPTLQPGQRMFQNRYQLVELKGAGGMGVVWLAQDLVEQHPVILKFLHGVLVTQEEAMQQEVRVGKNLRHKNIVGTYLMEMEGPLAAIVLEYAEGEALHKKLAAQPRGFFETEEILLVRDITAALTYLHQEAKPRRLHGDLKPANIMVAPDGQARLMDFGLSHRISEGLSRHSKLNSPAAAPQSSGNTLGYASPQQLHGKPNAVPPPLRILPGLRPPAAARARQPAAGGIGTVLPKSH